jgi:DNA mismatch repair protein MutS
MSLIKEYFDLTNKYQREYGPNTILLMQVGSFLECYGYRDSKTMALSGSRIEDLSHICELNIANKHVCVGEKNVVMAGFIVPILEKYLKKLQEAGFTTVVYTQDEQCKNTTRSLSGIYSPGTFFSADDSSALTNHIACIWVHYQENKITKPKGKIVYVGVSDVDILTGRTTVFQFQEMYMNSPTTYDELERFLSIYNPSEAIVLSNLPSKETEEIIQYANLRCALIHRIDLSEMEAREKTRTHDASFSLLPPVSKAKNCEKQVYQREILQRFYEGDPLTDFSDYYYMEHVFACQSFCFLLDFIYQHNPYLVKKLSPPTIENKANRMILANHSLQQLNMIGNADKGKYSSVEKMLNRCLTPMGKRQFSYDLLNPITNADALNQEYEITDRLLSSKREDMAQVRQALSDLKDLSKWNRQMFIKKIAPRCFFSLYQNLETIKKIFVFVKECPKRMEYLLQKNADFEKTEAFCQLWQTLIETHVDLELAKEIDQLSSFETHFMKPGLDADLDKKTSMHKESMTHLESIKNYFNELLAKYEKKMMVDPVKFYETEKNSVRLIATNRRCSILKTLLPKEKEKETPIVLQDGFVLDCHQKNVSFELQGGSNQSIQTPQIAELCKTLYLLKSDIKECVDRVYKKFVEGLEGYQHELVTIIDFVTRTDILYTKAHIAATFHYCRPTIQDPNPDPNQNQDSFLEATGLRHALIEQIQQNELYVANDVKLDKSGVLLYGTNAVGKTSYIKSIGVALIMAQAGLYVPASTFAFRPFKRLFTRILGNDNLFKGLSTFAVEMSELRTILKQADNWSLVLGDEVCSGTESVSAISIFVAAIKKLHQTQVSFLFATHMHEIVKYEEIADMKNVEIKHMSVFYDREKDALVYNRKVEDGPGDSMYGLEVCKSLHLPYDFLEEANQIRMKYFPEAKNILSLKTSHFNSQKIMGLCEACGNKPAKEVHHLQHQKEALEDGFIERTDGIFHKNHVANLISLCETCHDTIHKEKTQHKKVKTSRGYIVNAVP